MNTILVIWTIVGFAARPYNDLERYGRRPIGEFKTPELCHKAAKDLDLTKKEYRCLETGK